jgi:hypothetical protein
MRAKGAAVLGVLGLLGLLALAQWNWFAAPLNRDEGEYAYSAWRMANGGVPYREAFLQKPPMILYTYWLAQRISETASWPVRVAAFLFVAGTMGVVGWIAKRECGTRCAWAAMALFVPMASFPFLGCIPANTEKFMNLPMLAALALPLHGRGGARPWAWAAAGACAALALLYKPICLPILAFAFAVWLVETFRKHGLRRAGMQVLAMASGGGLAGAGALAFFAAHGALGDLWEAAVAFNQAYAGFSGWALDVTLRRAWNFLRVWSPAVLLALACLASGSSRKGYWLGLFAIAMGVANLDQNSHYFIMAIPLWALVAAFGLDSVAQRLSRRWRRNWHAALTAVAAVVLFWPIAPVAGMAPRDLSSFFHRGNPFVESAEVARRVAERTRPGDPVFVAGSEPQILFHAKRRSSTRFVIAYPLTLPTRYQPAFQQEVLDALRRDPPEVVVWAASPASWFSGTCPPDRHARFLQELQALLETSYQRVGGYVWINGQGTWREPLEDPERPSASLVVYARKPRD